MYALWRRVLEVRRSVPSILSTFKGSILQCDGVGFNSGRPGPW